MGVYSLWRKGFWCPPQGIQGNFEHCFQTPLLNLSHFQKVNKAVLKISKLVFSTCQRENDKGLNLGTIDNGVIIYIPIVTCIIWGNKWTYVH